MEGALKRFWHHWEKWECYPAGFFNTVPPGSMSEDDARAAYADFLSDTFAFELAMCRVWIEWPHSCEQFLSNPSMNRIAWLGQSAMCIATHVPSAFKGGFRLLTESQQAEANATANRYLQEWIKEKLMST